MLRPAHLVRIAALGALCALAAFVPTALGRTQAPPEGANEIQLFPVATATHVTQPYKLTAFIVEREGDEPLANQPVTILVISGPNAGKTITQSTDDSGAAHFQYTSAAAGMDLVQASYFDADDANRACSNVVAETWVPLGSPLPKPPPGPPTLPPATSPPPSSSGGPTAGAQPAGCRAAALVKVPGATDFAPVQQDQALPPGTQVDVSGESALTIDKPTGQSMTFFGVPDNVPSQFTITSVAGGGAGQIGIKLTGGNFSACTNGSRYLSTARHLQANKKPKKPKPIRRLWGSGKGSYKTSGKYASAAIRGTYWLVADYCNGTLVTVRGGTVTVHDAVKNTNITVHSGQSYFAAAKP